MNRPGRRAESSTTRVALLAGQAFALGLTLSWVLIPASAIFLTAYGSELLPVTYIASAVAGVASSALLTRASRTRPLAGVARATLFGTAVLLVAALALLSAWNAPWVSFALLTLVPIIVPVGFIFIVGQAGLLLDVRALKASYGRVVAGFALGSAVGGLTGAPLLGILGPTRNLLAVAALAVVAFLVLVEVTRHRFPSELSGPEHHEAPGPRPRVGSLARNRYVMLIVLFQMLSAVESQWLDFHVFSSAAGRYESSEALARFVSRFSAIAYGADILFLLVAAGWLLRRFGLRFGLTANAIGVLALLLAVIVATALLGSGATTVFVLVVATRVTDLTLSDGSSRTSLSAAYQAVPGRIRSVAQATVEGLAVPLAIGASGAVLLVIEEVGGTGQLLLPTLTTAVVIAWTVVAVLTYRAYRVNLLASLRGRVLDPSELTLDDEGSLLAIDRLVESDDERDVRLGLDILTIVEHPYLSDRLHDLVADPRVGVRTDALERLVPLAPATAASAARAGIDDDHPDVRAACIRVLGLVGDADDRDRIDRHWNDPVIDVRVAVASALGRAGDAATRVEIARRIERLLRDEYAATRKLGARMLGVVDTSVPVDRDVVRLLLSDPSRDVVDAALDALRRPDDEEHLPVVLDLLVCPHHRRSAAAALVRFGDASLDLVDARLRDAATEQHAQEHLVRVVRDIGTTEAAAVLSRHVLHHDRTVGLSVLRALAAVRAHEVPTAPEHDLADIERVTFADLAHATRVVQALTIFEADPGAEPLCRALTDELDLVATRTLAALAIRGDTKAFERVSFQLEQRDPRSHALALEWLDVTLDGADRALVAILEPHATHADRLQAMRRWIPVPTGDRRSVLLDIIQDPRDDWRQPWLAACALLTAAQGPEATLLEVTTLTERRPTGHRDHADIASETLVDLRDRFRLSSA